MMIGKWCDDGENDDDDDDDDGDTAVYKAGGNDK